MKRLPMDFWAVAIRRAPRLAAERLLREFLKRLRLTGALTVDHEELEIAITETLEQAYGKKGR